MNYTKYIMISFVNLFSDKKGEINRFLSKFYSTDIGLHDNLGWEKEYKNPVEISELIGVYIDNIDEFDINMFVSIDKNVFINITEKNGNSIIQYLYERFPY